MAAASCPFGYGSNSKEAPPAHTQLERARHSRWWPDQLDLKSLRHPAAGPEQPSYHEEFLTLDLDLVKADIMELMVTSQEWWPADYGGSKGRPLPPATDHHRRQNPPRHRRHTPCFTRPLRPVLHPHGVA